MRVPRPTAVEPASIIEEQQLIHQSWNGKRYQERKRVERLQRMLEKERRDNQKLKEQLKKAQETQL